MTQKQKIKKPHDLESCGFALELMVGIEPQYTLYFQGSDAPAAMVEVSIFGSASDAAYADLTARICKIVAETLHIDASRIYVKYAEVEHWGWNGSNF